MWKSRADKKVPHLKAESRMVSGFGRRHFLIGAGLSLLIRKPAFAMNQTVRVLAFDNLHTGEKLELDYWREGTYLSEALSEVNHILRDFRTGDIHPIAPQLLDLLAGVRANLETREPVSVISGYRSPITNAMLRSEHEHSGVAAQSLHMQGMAIDIRIAGRSLPALHSAALAMRGGGVGYYPVSDFVHVDVGRVRTWSGS
jgi:uncharacterized protein YcbK (DUF882 family)